MHPSHGSRRRPPRGSLLEIREIDVDALAELQAGGATIVDVRNPDEYESAHVPESVALPGLPSGSATAPTVSLAQARRAKVASRIDAAYGASAAYLAGDREG